MPAGRFRPVSYTHLDVYKRQELPDMEEAPADEWEEKILAIWQRILEKTGLGIHSDYFLSGGDSLNAVDVYKRQTRDGTYAAEQAHSG